MNSEEVITFKVLEIFGSISGEAQHAGELTTFVRFQTCNLCCSFCDTMSLMKANGVTEMTLEEIVDKVNENGHKHVVLTGGEPLLQRNLSALAAELLLEGHTVEFETNGTQDFHRIVEELDSYELPYAFNNNYCFTIDYKMGFSGMEGRMNPAIFEHLDDLSSQDTIKFVIAQDDIEHCMELIEKFQEQGTLCKYYISPVFGEVNMPDIIEAMKKHKLNEDVRYQLQIHKYVWEPTTQGV